MSTPDDTNRPPTPPPAPRLPRTAALGPGRGGLPRLLVDAAAGGGEIYLHGAHLTSWRPRGGEEVLFVSRRAVFDGVHAIRGGVPICAPWFAEGVDGGRAPAHGWARIRPWELRSAQATASGGVRALFALEHDGLSLLYEVGIGEELSLEVSLRNTGAAPRTVEAALHTYLAVGDVTAVSITGLEGARYSDRLTDEERVQDGPIRFSGRVDRIYRARGPVAVTDPAGARRIVVTGVRAPNAVVWNPWNRVAATMADLGEEWPSMVCVESAAVRDRAVRLEPGESTSLGARIGVEPLA